MNRLNQQKTVQQKRIDILVRLALVLGVVMILFFFVVKPMIKKDYYFEAGKDYKFDKLGEVAGKDSYDVAVLGNGLDAVASAIGAAEVGAKTLLVCDLQDIGDYFKGTLDISWAADVTPNGNSVSSDFFKKIRYKAGEASNIDAYIKEIKTELASQKNLSVIYSAPILKVTMDYGKINGITLKTPEGERSITAKRYIDATWSGEVIRECGVKHTLGYGDIGIDGLYQPVKLNFMISGVDSLKVQEFFSKQSSMVNYLLKSYKTSDNNIFISGITAADQGNGNIVIDAINVSKVDMSKEGSIVAAYTAAKKECGKLYEFLKANIDELKDSDGITVARNFSMVSPYNYNGKYHMTLSDVLTGKRYTDRISTASRPVTLTMDDGNRYVLCNPKTFYIPMGSIIPEGLDNALMTGDKISASSLVKTSINTNASRAGTGYAAGIIAAYSISRDMDIPMLIEDRNLDTQQEIEKILRQMGIYMSDVKEDVTSITGNWSYSYAEKLINQGLLSGGITNDYKYDKEAKCKDLAYIILNGVARMSDAAYNYKFDTIIRSYLTDKPLSKEAAAKIMLELTGHSEVESDYYNEARKLGLIDDTLDQKLNGREVLKLSEVYYGSVALLQKLTGRVIK